MISLDQSTATVFIAEDNPILLQGLGRALTAHGYMVMAAEDGPTVLEMLETAKVPPDLLLLDVMMPGMTGFEVLRTVHAEPRWADLPVVLITAATDESLAVRAMHSGAADVMIKPFRLGELLSRIDGHIQQYRKLRRQRDESVPLPAPAN